MLKNMKINSQFMIIRSKNIVLFCLINLWVIPIISAQTISPKLDHQLQLIQKEYSGDKAYQTTEFVSEQWRLPGNSGFNESIFYVQRILEEAGFQKADEKSKAPLTFRLWTKRRSK